MEPLLNLACTAGNYNLTGAGAGMFPPAPDGYIHHPNRYKVVDLTGVTKVAFYSSGNFLVIDTQANLVTPPPPPPPPPMPPP